MEVVQQFLDKLTILPWYWWLLIDIVLIAVVGFHRRSTFAVDACRGNLFVEHRYRQDRLDHFCRHCRGIQYSVATPLSGYRHYLQNFSCLEVVAENFAYRAYCSGSRQCMG